MRPIIVFCNPSFFPIKGGIENWIFQIATRLVKHCSVYIITRLSDKSWSKNEVMCGVQILRYTVGGLGPILSNFSVFIEALNIVRSVRMVSDKTNQIVFNFFDPRPAHVYAARFMRRQVVQHVVFTIAGTMSELVSMRVKKLAAHSADNVIGISKYAIKAFGVSHQNMRVFYPVGKKPIDFMKRRASFDSKQVLTVCRIHPRKNLDAIIYVAQSLPELSFKVVGDCTINHEYYVHLTQKIKKVRIKNIKFLGQISENLLHKIYSNSTLFFLPTHHEMFGLVFAEAMSYGLPIVSPNHTAIPEAVGPESGYLYEPNKLDDAVGTIREIANCRKRWLNLSSRSKTFMEQCYSHDYIGQYSQMLLDLVGLEKG